MFDKKNDHVYVDRRQPAIHWVLAHSAGTVFSIIPESAVSILYSTW